MYLDKDLPLAWYAGSEVQPDLQDDLAAIIRHIAVSTGAENLIFFGGSGGGFAALQMAQKFPGSIAVPVNPQTDISRYLPWAVKRYADHAWSGTIPDAGPMQDLTTVYCGAGGPTIAYVQNADDRFHIDYHLTPFIAQSPTRLHLDLAEWGAGHTPPPKPYLTRLLSTLTRHAPAWDVALDELDFVRSPDHAHVASLRIDGPLTADVVRPD